jgi:hypothetical protein
MAEVVAELDAVVTKGGRVFGARVCGAPMDDIVWQGWIEFIALDDGEIVRTPRETTQPNRVDLAYWASGLTPTYVEGALARALSRPPVLPPRPPAVPAYEEPAASVDRVSAPRLDLAESVLDPFSIYEKGEHILRQQLGALAPWHLANVIRAYRMSEVDPAALAAMPSGVLIEVIVAAVRGEPA